MHLIVQSNNFFFSCEYTFTKILLLKKTKVTKYLKYQIKLNCKKIKTIIKIPSFSGSKYVLAQAVEPVTF